MTLHRRLMSVSFLLVPMLATAAETGICTKEIQTFAHEKLGSPATNISFDWDAGQGGGGADGGYAYFNTENCSGGQYQVEFYAGESQCADTYYGSDLPKYVGKLLVVPEGCKGEVK